MSDEYEIDDTAAAEMADDTSDAEASAPAPLAEEQEEVSMELTAEEQAQIAELDEALEKFEGQKRWSDYIRTLLQKAEIFRDPEMKANLYRAAGMLYLDRSSNQAEAIKCFEHVLEVAPNDIESMTRLKEMYEKRRDWESLIGIMGREAEMLDPADRPLRFVEMAELATERLRKPDICIDLWKRVLTVDPSNGSALDALSNLYERAREWEPLAGVLEVLCEGNADESKLLADLQKLGMIYADKIGDDAGAVRAFQRVLALDPNDRRAQEQLKRRYVALKAWDDLELFYADSEKWDELIRLIEKEADGKETPDEEKIDLLFRAARLWEEKKEKPDRAARAYEKVLDIDADNLRAAESLSPIYESANDPRKLVAVYEVRLRHVTDPDQRVALLRETGLLYEERLRSPEQAFEKYLEAFGVAPHQEVVREDVDRLSAGVEGGVGRVIEAYAAAIEAGTDPVEVTELRMSFGAVLTQAERIDDAIAQYRVVYDDVPDHEGAISALAELYRQTQRFSDMLGIYDRRIELESDPEARRQMAYARASLFVNELSDPAHAVEAYQAILAEYGDAEVDAYRALDELFESQGRWADFADIVERRILLAESPEEEAALKFRLGRALEEHLDQKTRAVELYHEVVSALPEHDGAREALEALLVDETVGVQSARILVPIYQVREENERLIRALRVLHRGTDVADERLELLTQIGDVYAYQIENPAKAFDAFCEALREVPSDANTLARLEAMAIEQESFAPLVELVGELAGSVEDTDLARTLWIKAAQIYDTQLGNVDGAVTAYRKVLDLDPADLEVLEALENLYRRTERWSDLVGVLRSRVSISVDPGEQEMILSQMALIHDEYLNEPESAISLHREILEIDPASQNALSALDGLFARQEMWTELADNVDRQLAMADDPDRQIALMLQLAQLRETRMNATEAAIEIYRNVLDRDPSNGPATEALERLLQQPEHQVIIAEILEPIYLSHHEYQKLIGVHEIQATHASSPERRVELLHRISELHEEALDDAQGAFSAMARALAEDPANATTQAQLDRLNMMIGGAEQLAAVYEERVATVEDPVLAASLYVKAAEIREEQLADTERAIQHYRKVLELDEQHLEAASALERLFHLSERYEDLAAIYMTKAGMLADPDEQKAHLFRGAQIYEELLERPEAAIGVYGKVLEIDQEDQQALDKLIELHLRLEQWPQLLSVYERKADIVYDPDEKKRIYVEMGAVYERELQDVAKAIDTYQRILEIDPEDLTAIQRLDQLYQTTENWSELMSVLEREAELAHEPMEVISYRYRIAELWHRRLNDPNRAVDIYRDIFDVDPSHAPTTAALEAMIAEGTEPVAAASVLEPIYRQLGESARLIAVHEVQIQHEEDPLRSVELLHQVAELHELHLDQTKEAFNAYARALPLDHANEVTLGSLQRLADVVDGWNDVTRLYDVEVERIRRDAPHDVVDMALRTAQIYEIQVGDVDRAIDRYSIVLSADDTNLEAINALDRLYESTQRYAELAGVLQRQVQVAATPDDILNNQFRLGQVYQHHLGDVDSAIEQYREILAAAPEHQPAMSALELLFAEGVRPLVIGEIVEPIYRMSESWDRLLNVHEVQLNYQSDPHERVHMMQRIAEIAEERAADHDRAYVWVQRALLEDPSNEQTLAEVERLGSVLDHWAQLANTYVDALARTEDTEQKVALGKRLARVYEEELADVARAEETFRYVLSVDPNDHEVLEALDRIYVANGSQHALSEVLKLRVAASDDTVDKVDFSFRLGSVLEDQLGRTEEAIAVYRKILDELEPEHADSIRALQVIYTRQEDWTNLFAVFQKELGVVFGDAQQGDITAKMARLATVELGDPEQGVTLWKQVLELRGEDVEALNALGSIYAHAENWKDLVDVLDREVAITDDQEQRKAIYTDLGRVWYEKLQRDRNALDAWEEVLAIEPGNIVALANISEIYRAAQQWHELADALHRTVEAGAATMDDASITHVHMQLGSLYATQLEQPLDAAEAYRNALDVNPAHFDALAALEVIYRNEGMWEDAIGVMEQRVNALPDDNDKIAQLLAIANTWAGEYGDADRGTSAFQRITELSPMHNVAFARLEALHTEAGRWEDLIEVYVQRVENTGSAEEQVALLCKVAHVNEDKLRQLDQAFDALLLAWSVDFTNQQTADQLEDITRKTKKWNDLLATANASLQETEDPATKIAICLNCAKWYGQDLGHPEYAIPYYQQILAIDSNNVPAMQQMAALYRSTKQWDTLAQVLGRLVEMTDDPDVLADTYVQMGQLAETQLNIPEQAGQYYVQALEAAPANVAALTALEGVHRREGRYPELLSILQRKAAALTQQPDILAAKLQVAEVFEDRLGQPQEGIRVYREVFEADDTNLVAMKGLERLYAQTEQYQGLLEVLERQLEIADTERERITLLTRIALMQEEEFVRPAIAADRLEQVVDIDPNHEPSLNGLARLYRGMQEWDKLIDTYERHVQATPERAEKIRLFKATGEVFAENLKDVDRAIDSYLNALSVDEEEVDSLGALTVLYEERGDHSSALDMMGQLVKLIDDPEGIIDLRFRMGRILEDELGDRGGALEHFEAALDVNPGHLPSLEALRKIHLDSADWLSAAKTLQQEVEYTEAPRVKSELLVELGRVYADNLDEPDKAVQSFAQALAFDEDNEDAALPLAQHHFDLGGHAEAYPLLYMLGKRASKREQDEQHRLALMLGESALAVGNTEEAIKAYNKAYQIDSAHLPSLTGVAAAYYAAQDWEKAFKFYQMLLVHHRDSLGREEITDIFYRLGVVKREQDEKRKALNMFDKALEEDAFHRPTLLAVIGLYEEQQKWDQVIHYKKQLLEVAETEDERFDLNVEIGDLWNDKQKNPGKAIESYREATYLKPDDHPVLHKLLAAYQRTKQWEEAIEIIEQISAADKREAARAKFSYTIAVIRRDELKDVDGAIDKFNEALDTNPKELKAFEAINKILTEKKDWKGLERAYRKMLHRIINMPDMKELQFNLLHTLGIIYRDRQKNFDSAAEAFRMASGINPDAETVHVILAELYSAMDGKNAEAIGEHQWLLKRDPNRVESYRALYKLYFDARAYDKAWCVAATLSFLKKADNEQQQFFQQYKQDGMIRPTARIDNERWLKLLFHPDEDLVLSKIFELMAVPLFAVKGASDQALNLHQHKAVDVANTDVMFARTFGFVMQVMNLAIQPRLFVLQNVPGGMADQCSKPLPSVVAGNGVLTGYKPQDLTFLIGRHLAYYRGEHFIRTMLQSHTELRMVLLAALRIAGVGAADPQVDQWAQQLVPHFQQAQVDTLRGLCRRFIDAGGAADVKVWMQCVESTAIRAGFLLCNDLETAANLVRQLPPAGTADLPPGDKLKELVLFSISEQYFALREGLGIQIQV
ncbi:MAG: tetratricopeptide repeat protein [Sandaracinaceae bacterium]|nr:tetratricopeptide repeat protein [Sandaracinaceae bacterium]